jgi:hypothetical protein
VWPELKPQKKEMEQIAHWFVAKCETGVTVLTWVIHSTGSSKGRVNLRALKTFWMMREVFRVMRPWRRDLRDSFSSEENRDWSCKEKREIRLVFPKTAPSIATGTDGRITRWNGIWEE